MTSNEQVSRNIDAQNLQVIFQNKAYQDIQYYRLPKHMVDRRHPQNVNFVFVSDQHHKSIEQ